MRPNVRERAATKTQEKVVGALNGYVALVLNIGILGGGVWALVRATTALAQERAGFEVVLGAALVLVLGVLASAGYFTLQPNEARVLILFGRYVGTVVDSGFWWANPFYSRGAGPKGKLDTPKLSLRARNFTSEKLKVNDKRGSPIEIAAVVVWRVSDTAKAVFDVESFQSYVQTQSESAIRHIATLYAYDRGDEHEPTLRESGEEVAAILEKELQTRLDRAGVVVEEARITHLAYAPEIAHAMLRRQQAEAVIAARQKIVHGAVSMVDQALRELAEKNVVQLDDERKASMVSNLLVVLCGESEASPVINTGTLYP